MNLPRRTHIHTESESVKGVSASPPQLKTLQEEAQKLGSQAGHIILDEIAKAYQGTAQFVTDLKDAIEQLVQYSRKSTAELEEIVGKNNITTAELAHRLEEAVSKVDLGLKKNMLLQLRECAVDARALLVARVLDKMRSGYVTVLTGAGVSPEQAAEQYSGFAARLTSILLIISKHAHYLSIQHSLHIWRLSFR